MSTTTPFAINLGSAIQGTTQVGNIAIGASAQDYSSRPGGVTWYMGPDEDLGYIVAYQNGSDPTFWRSAAKTDESLLLTINNLPARSGQTPFVDINTATSWLTSNGYYYSAIISAGQYTLASDAYVSVGIFYKDGNETNILAATIESYAKKSAGTYTVYWDGYNDDQTQDISGDHIYFPIVQIMPNVQATWLKPIGNTSTDSSGTNKHVNNKTFTGMVTWIDPDDGVTEHYITVSGYSEARSCLARGLTSTWQSRTLLLPTENTPLTGDFVCISSNKRFAFFAGIAPYGTASPASAFASFVYSLDLSTNEKYALSSGTSVQLNQGPLYSNTIAGVTGASANVITGIACYGNYLFVARGSQNTIDVYNVGGLTPTGAFVRTITGYTAPKKLMASSIGILWFIQTVAGVSSVVKGVINASTGEITTGTLTITNTPTLPDSLGISYDGFKLYIFGAGSEQQFWIYDVNPANGTGTTYETKFGQTGGYRTNGADANVTDKFYGSDSNAAGTDVYSYIPESFIFGATGSIYISDLGNERIRKYDLSMNWVANLQTIPLFYSVSSNKSNPDSIFIEYMEFRKNVGETWDLAYNWRHDLANKFFADGSVYSHMDNNVAVFDGADTYTANGETYALLNYYPYATDYYTGSFVPYPEYVRFDYTPGSEYLEFNTSVNNLGAFAQYCIEKGTGNRYRLSGNRAIGSTAASITKTTLTGFDGLKRPEFGAETTFATFTTPIAIEDAIRECNSIPAVLDDGTVVYFQPALQGGDGIKTTGYHIGATKQNYTSPIGETNRGTQREYYGEHSSQYGMFDIGSNTNNPGGVITSAGNFAIINEHDEFWKQSQTNIMSMYSSLMLKVCHFGITVPDALAIYGSAAPQRSAGNTISTQATLVNSDKIRFVGNDESVQSAAQLWEITGLSGIEVRELSIIPPPNYAPVDGSAVFVGLQSKQTPLIPTAKITVSTTPYTVDGDNYFLTYTNRDSVDLFKSVTARYRGRSSAGSTSQYIKFDLTPTGLTTKATLRGRINFSEDNAINGGTPSEQGAYFRVYDSTNKKLIEIYTKYAPDDSYNYTSMYVNGNILFTFQNRDPSSGKTSNVFNFVTHKSQDFVIEITASGVRFKYYNYNRDDRTTTLYDSGVLAVSEVGADWTLINNAKMDMVVSTAGASSDHALTIDDLVEKYE
jgi:hypothetical protein